MASVAGAGRRYGPGLASGGFVPAPRSPWDCDSWRRWMIRGDRIFEITPLLCNPNLLPGQGIGSEDR